MNIGEWRRLSEIEGGATRVAGRDGGSGYRLTIASAGGTSVRASSGMGIEPDADLAELDPDGIDTLLVPGGRGRVVLEDSDLVEELPRVVAGARRFGSVCGGAFLLAAAGLLDGRRGAEVARTVARWLVVFLQRPGGQSQFSQRLGAPVPAESPIRALVDGIIADPAGEHTVPALAERASLSERQVTRLFAREVRATPARFVERVRVEAARELLESGRSSVDAVAPIRRG